MLCEDLGRLGALTALESLPAVNQKEVNDVLRHVNNQGTLLYSFIMLLLYIKPTTYAKNDAIERKGKFHFLSLFPYLSGSRR